MKKRVDQSDRKRVVYEIECCCGIGETGQTLNTGIKEHKYAVRRYDPNNGISVHANATMHNMNWEDARIVGVEQNTLKRKYIMHCRKSKESIFEPGLWPTSPSLMDKLH